ncbi:MAG: ribonuclease III [SAR202 cluster bacterium]|nr:ribonuclease III [SAR202 cluster bacterium]|tara:strand:- start:30190 stop:30894 length:705 start_codon:yes stop_codon:yes gene_type:complete
MDDLISEIETVIGIKFNQKTLLLKSIIHKSLLNENPDMGLESNERLEFLGDSIIQTSVSDLLYNKHPDWAEGTLSQARSKLVNRESLAKLSITLGLGKYLKISNGEEESGGRNKDSNLADAFEALVGAIFLDQGFDTAQSFVNSFMVPLDIQNPSPKDLLDPKSMLQIKIQQGDKSSETGKRLKYKTISISGKSPNQEFIVQVSMDNKILGKGKGSKKSQAEQNAASDALKILA